MTEETTPPEEPTVPAPAAGESIAEPTEEQMRAALEEEMRRVHVGDVVIQSVVSLINIGARRTGSTPDTEAEQDLTQAAIAIDSVTALLPVVEQLSPEQAGAVRDALSQLQLAWVKAGGKQSPSASGSAEAGQGQSGGVEEPPDQDPPSRIWVPGR